MSEIQPELKPSRWTRIFPVPGGNLTIEAGGEEPRWFLPTGQALAELLYLSENWDSYGARPISRECVSFVIEFLLEIMQRGTPAPTVVPTNRGGVQLEWHAHGIDLEVEIRSPGHIFASYEDQQSGNQWEEELSSDFTPLSHALLELVRRK